MSTKYAHTRWVYAHLPDEVGVWNNGGCAHAGLWVSICVFIRACARACECSTWLSSAWTGQSLICRPLWSTDMQPNQTDIKTERKASLCSSAVQFVLTLSGTLSSPLILMSSPGIRLRRPASQWSAWVGGMLKGEIGGEGINTPTQTHTQTLNSPQHADTSLFEQEGVRKHCILYLLEARQGKIDFLAHPSTHAGSFFFSKHSIKNYLHTHQSSLRFYDMRLPAASWKNWIAQM